MDTPNIRGVTNTLPAFRGLAGGVEDLGYGLRFVAMKMSVHGIEGRPTLNLPFHPDQQCKIMLFKIIAYSYKTQQKILGTIDRSPQSNSNS